MKRRLSLNACIDELKKAALSDGVDLSGELASIAGKIEQDRGTGDAWDLVRRARDPARPRAGEVIDAVFDSFDEFHGDRCHGDDGAIVGGIAFLEGRPVTVIANHKGHNLKETMARNAGMASPEGYRKALRLARQAEKFSRPIITFVDTAGAYPGLGSEARGIGEAIAMNLREFSRLATPIVCVVLGEGGSGGALGLCVGDRILMLENSYFSVTTPEVFASLVLHDATLRERAAGMMGITPSDLLRCGFCDGIIGETRAGHPIGKPDLLRDIRARLVEELSSFDGITSEDFIRSRNERYQKF